MRNEEHIWILNLESLLMAAGNPCKVIRGIT